MARDYGYKASAKRGSSGPNQLLVLVLTFLCGYLTATVFDTEKLSHWFNNQVLAEHKQPAPKQPAAHAAQTPPKPKFEFYTLLANEKVPSQASAAAKSVATASNTAPTTTSTAVNLAVRSASASSTQAAAVKVVEARPVAVATLSKGSFSLQVASFKTRKDAEHIKGLLTLKGYDVRVIAVSQARGNWFRVVVGPFANKVLAQQAQSSIANTERLHGMITTTS